MVDDLLATIGRFGVEVLPISIMGWLGLRLVAWSAGKPEGCVRFGGPYTFIVVWGLAVFASCKTLGRASPAINTVYLSLLILGLLASFIRVVAEMHKGPSRRN